MELRVSPAFVGVLGLIAFFLVYRVLPDDLRCSPWKLHDSDFGVAPASTCGMETPVKSFAQVLKDKAGKLSTSEEELAGLGFSTKALLAEVVQDMSAGGEQEQQLFNSNYGVLRVIRRLVVCSAYRTSLRDFTVITLSPDFTIPTSNPDFQGFMKEPAVSRTCLWLPGGDAGGPLFGSLSEMNETGRSFVGNGAVDFRWMQEIHGTSYDTLLVHCSFPKPVGTDLSGGFLYLNISHGALGSELAPVFHEPVKKLKPAVYEATVFEYEFAFCSAPVFTVLTSVHVKEFLMYHHSLLNGSVHFFIYYTLPIDDATMAVLQPLVDAGILTLVDFGKEKQYDTWYHSQGLAINDCLYRTRFLANWTLFWDLDEYLHIRPPFTLGTLLEQHKDAAWISFGKIDFSLKFCPLNGTGDGEWAIERMLYREEFPICGEKCHGDSGARKWMGNPRKVRGGRVHYVVDPGSTGDGVVIPTTVGRFNHYRGLVAPRGRYGCQQITNPEIDKSTKDGKLTLWKDDELAKLVVSSSLRRSAEALPMFG